MDVITGRFSEYGFPLYEDNDVIPDDDTTLFVCSGMQKLKNRFAKPDGKTYGSVQSCIRTNDLDLVGDGSHLTFFQMIGNFSFGTNDYGRSVRMWRLILEDLGIKNYAVHHHPSRPDHRALWDGCELVEDPECTWTDGEIGGECCEIYVDGLEVGNLVNTLGHSTDVGFGLERLIQVLGGEKRVDDTELFDGSLDPVARDHVRTLKIMRENRVQPGNKGREYVCRRLLRRTLRLTPYIPGMDDWVRSELELLDKRLSTARKLWRKHQGKSPEWWWDTCGVLPEELDLCKT